MKQISRIPQNLDIAQKIAEAMDNIPTPTHLSRVERVHQHQERVYQRPNETIYETTDTTIEIYEFD